MITNNKLLLLLLTEFFCFWMIVIPASAALKDNWSYVDTEYSVASIVYGNERFAGFFDDHSEIW
ncbi:MAG: hypothetical protein IJ711_12150 [Lachnospiraceae bacterium]|nr:hypothetical protein [Lachnospiraceae bacterium]